MVPTIFLQKLWIFSEFFRKIREENHCDGLFPYFLLFLQAILNSYFKISLSINVTKLAISGFVI